MKSKLGWALVILYILFLGYVWFAALSCEGWFCGSMLLLAIMPWPFILGDVPSSLPVFIILILLNGTILYFIGLGISRLFHRNRGALKRN